VSPRPRRRVLLANELGRGFGHLHKLQVVAGAVREIGDPVLAVGDDELARALAGLDGPIPTLPTPPLERRDGPPPESMGDILAAVGMADRAVTGRMLQRWDARLAELDPALVVTDYAPFLALATQGRVPRIALGSGFTLPPEHLDGFPHLFIDQVVPHPALDATIAEVLAARGTAPVTAPALLAGERPFVCVLPELDLFAGSRRRPASGPLQPPPPLPPPGGPTFFAYLAAEAPGCLEILRGLAGARRAGSVFVRGADAALAATVAGSAVRWCEQPAPLDAALAGCGLIVHHGGINTAQRALLAGRPQLVVPDYLEQALNGRELAALGVGQVLPAPDATAAAVAAAVGAMTHPDAGSSGWAAVAHERARLLRDRVARGCLDQVVATARALAGR
jgi:rhamnosyltransferase subunit B